MAYKSPALSYFEWQQPVIDKDLVDPPGGETKGDRYLIDGVGINAWAGEDGNIATYNGAGWDFTDKKAGMFVYVTDENLLYLYKAAWGVAAIGDVVAGANLTDLAVVRGDGGAKGVKTSTMLISDAGEMTNPSQPAFLVYNSVTDLNATGNGTQATIDFNIEVFDQGGDFVADTFTAPVDGRYLLQAQIVLAEVAGDEAEMRFQTSNRVYYGGIINPNVCKDGLNYLALSMTAKVDMDADDTVTVRITVWNAGGDTVDIYGTGAPKTYFSGALIC